MTFTREVPAGAWSRVLCAALLLVAASAATIEWRLAERGFQATVFDSEALWLEQRARVTALGPDALVLVGASRMQLDMDLAVLRERTGLEPVQLAVDGSSFVAVLASLADDPAVTGAVMVSYQDHAVRSGAVKDIAARWAAAYGPATLAESVPDFQRSEAWLEARVRGALRAYADQTRPLTALLARVLPADATPQYLLTLHDRSRLADYRQVQMPEFYYRRVLSNLGEDEPAVHAGMDWTALERQLRARIARLAPAERGDFDANTHDIARMKRVIEQRGGRLIFVVLPTSGLVRDIDEKRYPRAEFWDRFARTVGEDTLHYADVPALRELRCPDGSHLDFRDQGRFTEGLADALQVRQASQ